MTERQERDARYGSQEGQAEDPAGRSTPYVDGPTGPAPLSSELRGDPGAEGDRKAEGGAVAGAIAGTSLAGPVGGVVGAMAGGAIGSVAEADVDSSADAPEDAADRAPDDPTDRG